MERDFGEILNESVDRLIAGEPMDAVLERYPEHASALTPALRDAQLLLRSGPPTEASPEARTQARQVMRDELRRADAAAAAAPKPSPPAAVTAPSPRAPMVAASASSKRARRVADAATSQPSPLVAFLRRPASFRAAALAGGLAVFGVLGVGAAAATGNAPEPVRELFGSSAGAALRVEFDGVILAADPAAQTFDVAVGDDQRLVRVVDSTELSRGGEAIAFDAFAASDPVEVKGALQPDDTIIATRVHLEDDDDVADADDEPAGEPTANGEANSGPGNAEDDDDAHEDEGDQGEDEDEDEDNSGPGNAEDDDDEDNSGPGNAEDDEDQGNHSGPGGREDDD